MNTAKAKFAEKYLAIVESKLFVETKAVVEKKREKFDPKKDGPGKDAETFGGRLHMAPALRNQPQWR